MKPVWLPKYCHNIPGSLSSLSWKTLSSSAVHFRPFRISTSENKMSHVVRKPAFWKCKTAKLISAFVFATLIVPSFHCLNPKFQASSHLHLLYSPVCVGPGRKPRRPVFLQQGSNITVINFPTFHNTLKICCIQCKV